MITTQSSGTNVFEVADGIFRINTPVEIPGAGAFSFNQYLVRDDEPLLFHTGPRGLFPLVSAAIGHVLPIDSLRYVAWSHLESDESGALNQLLAAAPRAEPVCGQVCAMVSAGDLADRPPRALADGETLALGRHVMRWFDAPHVPHGWDCGFLLEESTRTLMCGDLLTQPGRGDEALTESDVLEPSEAFRAQMDYYAHAPQTGPTLQRLAATEPRVLACMHGSAWSGDGGGVLRELAARLEPSAG